MSTDEQQEDRRLDVRGAVDLQRVVRLRVEEIERDRGRECRHDSGDPPADHRADQHEEDEDEHRVHLREVISDRHERRARSDRADRTHRSTDTYTSIAGHGAVVNP